MMIERFGGRGLPKATGLHLGGLRLGIPLFLAACAGGGSPPADMVAPPPVALAETTVAEPAGEQFDSLLLDLKGDGVPTPFDLILPDSRAAAMAVASRPSGTDVGYLLLDLRSGLPLAELNADLPLIPASTVKLATGIVALDTLGPEHRFRTEMLRAGEVRGGVLEGDLVLKGGGDPSLDLADLLEFVVRLEASGIRRVRGRFLIDDLALPRRSEIDPTQPPEAAYNPGIGALSLAFNRVRVTWRGGGAADVATVPPLDEARFEAAPPSLLPPSGIKFMSLADDGVVWRVADRGARRQEVALPVKDPGLHAGHVFARLALAQGIDVGLPRRGPASPQARLLAVHESPPLRQLVRDMLVYSNNMMAELIGLSAAARLGDPSAHPDAAGELLLGHLARLMPEVDWRGATLGNHSGLDGRGRLTARQLAAIARYGWDNAALPALLPGGGWSGTLSGRFNGSDETLRVWAKTGTLNYGSALAGYLFPSSGRPAVFVTMVSDVRARAAYDADGGRVPRIAHAARSWSARARTLQDNLVRGWLEPLPTS